MGCTSCSKKRKKHIKQFDAPLLDEKGKKISDSFLTYSAQQKASRKKTIKKTGRDMSGGKVDLDRLRNIETLPRTLPRWNILKHSANEMAVYIIGHFKGCSACRYMHKLIDKSITPEIKMDISFYSVEKNDVQPNGFQFRNNPTIVLVDHGKAVRQVAGMNHDIMTLIKNFQNKKEEKVIKKVLSSNKSPWVVKLKPDPTHVASYERLLDEMGDKKDRIKNITTFLDQTENILVVTIDFKE